MADHRNAVVGSLRRQAIDRGLHAVPANAGPPARAESEREVLMRVAAAAAGASKLEEVIELVAEAALEAVSASSLAMSKFDADEEAIRVLINVGDLSPIEERLPEAEIYPLADFPAVRRLIRTGIPYFTAVDDPDAEPKSVKLLRKLGKESDIGVPVIVDGRVWGEIWATTAPGHPRFHAGDVRFLESIAAQLAGVIGRAELFSDVERLAYEDPLTGLANRRALEEKLEEATERWRADGTPVSLMLCDLDDLKTINDTRGHHAGDRALRRVAEALVAAAAGHPTAVTARLAGDEFAVVLPGHGVAQARDLAITALRLLAEDRDTPIAISCGAVEAGPGLERSTELLRAADSAQYASKRRGGGQVCTAEASALREFAAPRARGKRRGLAERLDATTETVLELLDGDLAAGASIDRLEITVAHFAETVNAAAWTISFAAHGSREIRSISTADDRDGRLRGIRVGLGDEVYDLEEFPATATLVKKGGGSFIIDRHDRDSDPAERELLAELGFSEVLAAATSDVEGVWLIEIYGDGDTSDLSAADLRVQLTSRAAASRSSAAAEQMSQLQKRTRQLTLTGSLGAKLAGLTDEQEIVEAALDEIQAEFGDSACGILRLTKANEVEIASSRSDSGRRLKAAGWRQPAGLGLIGRALRERQVVISGDVRAEPDYRDTPETVSVRAELCAPLWAGDHLWGAINVEDTRPEAFDTDDAQLVRTVADQVSSALRSTRLYATVEQAYLDTAEALASALEAKDSYTAEHSRSIAENAEAVGRVLGMDPTDIRMLRFGAAFHDIGKLAIPGSILNKPGRLTPEERAHIERHTIIGEQIIAPIDFLAPVRPLVRHGHERWDGGGYPDGLAGEDIPLGARIIFACDAYDAMTTDRPYRSALTATDALTELQAHAGTQFDPTVVRALVEALAEAAAAAA
jgi:diguanylate cyclase (GGDEF)-like protein